MFSINVFEYNNVRLNSAMLTKANQILNLNIPPSFLQRLCILGIQYKGRLVYNVLLVELNKQTQNTE